MKIELCHDAKFVVTCSRGDGRHYVTSDNWWQNWYRDNTRFSLYAPNQPLHESMSIQRLQIQFDFQEQKHDLEWKIGFVSDLFGRDIFSKHVSGICGCGISTFSDNKTSKDSNPVVCEF